MNEAKNQSKKPEFLFKNLPDAEGAQRFLTQFEEKHQRETQKLLRSDNQGLLADVLALTAWSGFLASTLLQHSDYIAWLDRQRNDQRVRTTEDLLEALARFSLVNSELEPCVLLARFRRRELLRIYLRDIRGQATVAEITEDLSNLADAILEFALRIARQELENRYGVPLASDAKGKTKTAEFCVVALGKLGSKELNYASDIDLLFLYSSDGATSPVGSETGKSNAGNVTNREFFVKLAERTAKIIGQTTGETGAYRVDLRLRPHGRVGALAVSLKEAVNYYQNTARDWERQILLRARSAAGDAEVFKSFAAAVEKVVYRKDISVAHALSSVSESKRKINQELKPERGFNVKLGAGGIREIEFIAQALQLAYGGRDEWLRAAHTLICLSRLSDHEILTQPELTTLSDAYVFLRTLEHRLQMEQGLQTHVVPIESAKREIVARRMNFAEVAEFDAALQLQTNNVSTIYQRIFKVAETFTQTPQLEDAKLKGESAEKLFAPSDLSSTQPKISASLEKLDKTIDLSFEKLTALNRFCQLSPYFAEILAANPKLIENLPIERSSIKTEDYQKVLLTVVADAVSFAEELALLREAWAQFYLEIAALDAFEKIEMREANRLQTKLAEASLDAALLIVKKELGRRFAIADSNFKLGVLGLGRIGARGMDYGSDLDLVLIYDGDAKSPVENLTAAEFYTRAAEIFVTSLSNLTREGQLYRVDLRLRPDGKNGAPVNGKKAILNYLQTRAAIWEWLAYVKLRAVGGDFKLAQTTEIAARQTVHSRAEKSAVSDLKSETKKVRNLLEQQKTKGARRGEINIKHGAGGLLDVYFAVRFLQLRDNLFDEEEKRTTSFTLRKLRETNSLDTESFESLSEGYEFLRRLDHALRLIAGRSTRLSSDRNNTLLSLIANRLKCDSADQLLANLAFHTARIRNSYDKLLS